MKPIWMYLDEAIDRGIVKNDFDLARRLGVNRSAVSKWRAGTSAPNEDQAAKLAELLGRPEILAECMAARVTEPAARAVWERAAVMLSRYAAVVFLLVTGNLFLTPPPAGSVSDQGVSADSGSSNVYYVKFWRALVAALLSAHQPLQAFLSRPAPRVPQIPADRVKQERAHALPQQFGPNAPRLSVQ